MTVDTLQIITVAPIHLNKINYRWNRMCFVALQDAVQHAARRFATCCVVDAPDRPQALGQGPVLRVLLAVSGPVWLRCLATIPLL